MKKKYNIIIVSFLVVIIATILFINKPSYATIFPTTNYCPEEVIVTRSEDTIELVEGIPLPKSLEVKTPSGDILDNTALILPRNDDVYGRLGEKGYENLTEIPTFSNNKEENRYYQQLFLWWMKDIDSLRDIYLTKKEKEQIKNSSNGKVVAEKIEEFEKFLAWNDSLTEEPKLTLEEINTKDITYYATNDYIETNLITPNCSKDYTFIFTDYEVKTTSPVIVVDEKGKEKTSFQKGEGFKLRISISEIKNNEINFQAEIIGKSTFDIWSQYYTSEVVNRGTASNIYLINCGKSKSEDAFESININYSIEVGTLNIKVIDAESKKELKDAEVVIYDKSGNIVYRYKTTGSTLNITLPVGEYTVKQIITPPNYQARVVEQKVTVTENGETDAVLENVQLLEVPDTNKTAGILPIIGLIILIGGMLTITIMLKKMRYTKGR